MSDIHDFRSGARPFPSAPSSTYSGSEPREDAVSTSQQTAVGSEAAHPPEVEDNFVCDVCGKLFPSIPALSGHMSAHGKAKQPCPTCGDLYLPGPGMARHRQIKHGAKKKDGRVAKLSGRQSIERGREECDVCHRTYAPGGSLRKHRRKVHGIYASGEKPTPEVTLPPEPESDTERWNVEDIFDAVVGMLWPTGKMPVKALHPLVTWRDATEKMLIEVQDE